MSELDFIDDDIIGFEPIEVDGVIANYVCSVCHGTLVSFQIPSERRSIIACLEHGNVEHCGRVTKNTVSIELERGYRQYNEVIRNLPDLWGDLCEEGFEYERAKKIAREYVCKQCGAPVYMTLIVGDREHVSLSCARHGNINQCGYVRKGQYHANSRSY